MYKAKLDDRESVSSRDTAEAMHSALAQIVGISILEVGVVLHRFVFIRWTLPCITLKQFV